MKLVFLHGAGSSSLSYYYQLRHFRNSKAIDLPGHSTGKACHDIESYLEWVRGFITARRYKDVVLCGHAMGGAITLLYALRYPEELKGIILMGTGARLHVHPDYLDRCREPGPDNSKWLAGYMKSFKHVSPDMHPVLSQRAVELGPEVQLNDLLACDRFDVMDQLGKIYLPTQVLCGSDDVMTPVKYADYLTEHMQNARGTVIPGATHFVQMEEYKKVNEEIEQFMASLK